MTDQEVLGKYAATLDNFETKEAYLLDGFLYFKREYRDPRELQTRVTYHKIDDDVEAGEENLIGMKDWATARKTGEKVK